MLIDFLRHNAGTIPARGSFSNVRVIFPPSALRFAGGSDILSGHRNQKSRYEKAME
jgi:hypothetical protein